MSCVSRHCIGQLYDQVAFEWHFGCGLETSNYNNWNNMVILTNSFCYNWWTVSDMINVAPMHLAIMSTVKPALSGHLKTYKTKVLLENGSLMKVEVLQNALQYCWPALSNIRYWKPIFVVLFEWPLKTGFTVIYIFSCLYFSENYVRDSCRQMVLSGSRY